MKKVMAIIDVITDAVGCLGLVVLLIAIMMQVIWRYVFNSPLSWPEEVASFAFLISTYMGVSICMKNNSHLRITVLPEYCPRLWRPLDILSVAASLIFYGYCGYLGYGLAMDAYESQMVCVGLPLQMWVILMFIPLACIFVFLQAARLLIHLLSGGSFQHSHETPMED